jgi:hypothetical protein
MGAALFQKGGFSFARTLLAGYGPPVHFRICPIAAFRYIGPLATGSRNGMNWGINEQQR